MEEFRCNGRACTRQLGHNFCASKPEREQLLSMPFYLCSGFVCASHANGKFITLKRFLSQLTFILDLVFKARQRLRSYNILLNIVKHSPNHTNSNSNNK